MCLVLPIIFPAAITTDHATRYYLDFLAVKTLTNVISLIGNLASSVYIYFCLMIRLLLG